MFETMQSTRWRILEDVLRAWAERKNGSPRMALCASVGDRYSGCLLVAPVDWEDAYRTSNLIVCERGCRSRGFSG